MDALVQGIHFDDRVSAADVGWKAIAVSVSDLAAMGARPDWAVLSLSVAEPTDEWIHAFAQGLGAACTAFGVRLIGGDTTSSPGPTVVSVTLGGPCAAEPLTRSGGAPGDALWVTGIPGLAGAGWMLEAPPAAALEALRRPYPPLAFALDLARRKLAQAAMDLSDGLASDLPRLARASGTGARVQVDTLPSQPDLDGMSAEQSRRCRLAGGDDYQLLFAASVHDEDAILDLAAHHGVRATRIGALTEGLAVVASDGAWPAGSFQHFQAAS